MKKSLKTYLWILVIGITFGTTTSIASISQEMRSEPPGGGQFPPPPQISK